MTICVSHKRVHFSFSSGFVSFFFYFMCAITKNQKSMKLNIDSNLLETLNQKSENIQIWKHYLNFNQPSTNLNCVTKIIKIFSEILTNKIMLNKLWNYRAINQFKWAIAFYLWSIGPSNGSSFTLSKYKIYEK